MVEGSAGGVGPSLTSRKGRSPTTVLYQVSVAWSGEDVVDFPTSEEMASFAEHLYWSALKDDLEKHLGSSATVQVTGRRALVTVDGRAKVAAGVIDRPRSCWMVAHEEHVVLLPLESKRSDIVRTVRDFAWAIFQGRRVPSPYRWGEIDPSPITDLADVLEARGLDVRRVVVSCRLRAGAASTIDHVDEDMGEFLEVSDWDQVEVVVRRHQAVGWVADVRASLPEGDQGGRADLATQLAASVPRVPRAVPDNVDRHALANAVSELCHTADELVENDGFDPGFRLDDLEHWLPGWLRWLGLTGVSCQKGRAAPEVSAENAYVRLRSKGPTVADVERLAGNATDPNKARLLIGLGWPSRPTLFAADRLRVALFSLKPGGDPPWRPHGVLAQAMTPHCDPWFSRDVDEPDEVDDWWVNDPV